MAIKFSQFNLRTDHTSGMYLVGYDGNQNIHITVDNLFNDFINGTENTIAMFGAGGDNVVNSIVSQNAGATILTVAGQLNVDAAATFDTSLTVTGVSTLNGNVTLGDASTDLITQTGTLYLNGPVKDTTNTLGAANQLLLSGANGELTFANLSSLHIGSAGITKIQVTNKQGSSLTKGDPVFISGATAAEPVEVQLADASNAAKMPAVGILETNLANNATGHAIVVGNLTGLNTSSIDSVTPSAGQPIYVKPSGSTGAAITTTKPIQGNLIQNLGEVGFVNSSGSLVFSVKSETNDLPNVTPGKVLIGSTGNTIESATLFVDEANTRLGVGTNSPDQELTINGGTESFGLQLSESDRMTMGADGTWNYIKGKNGNGFRFSTFSGGDVLTLTNAGNVGIGTISPNAKLQVNDNVRIGNTSTGVRFYIRGADEFGIDAHDVSGNGWNSLHLRADGTTGLFLQKDTNNVGIGTTSPAGKLEVNGGTGVATSGGTLIVRQDGDTLSDGIALTSSNAISHRMFKNASGTFLMGPSTDADAFALDLNGNVGIGTTSPARLFHVKQSSSSMVASFESASGANSFICFSNTASTADQVRIGSTSGNLILSTNYSERLRINSSGNVGIGTTNPGRQLELRGQGIIRLNGISGEHPGIDFQTSDTNDMQIRYRAGTDKLGFFSYGTSTDVMTIQKSNGYVGIGTTSPARNLHIYDSSGGATLKIESNTANAYDSSKIELIGGNLSTGEIIFGDPIDSDVGKIIYRHDGNSLAFNVSASEKMRIDSSGNVGIGTTSPDSKLQVNTSSTSDVAINANGRLKIIGDGVMKWGSSAGHGELSWNSGYALYRGQSGNGIKLQVNGASTVMTLNTSGNVGIGTASPATKLHIADVTTPTIRIEDTTNNRHLQLFHDNNNSYIRSSTGSQLRFQTNGGNDRVVITTSGQLQFNNYGSGTFTGTATKNLAVDSSGNVIETDGSILDGSGTTNYVSKWSDANTLTDSQIFDNGTNVGIGTTSPGEKFAVKGDASYIEITHPTSTSFSGIKFSEGGTPQGTIQNIGSTFATVSRRSNFEVFHNTGGNLTLQHSGGNVGIGTSSPSAKLEVNGEAIFNTNTGTTPFYVTRQGTTGEALSIKVTDQNVRFESIQDEPSDGFGGFDFRMDSGTNEPDFIIRKGSDPALFLVNGGGNVGIGTTSPNAKLEVMGGVDKQLRLSTGTTTYWELGRSTSTGHFEITEDSGDTYFLIDKDNGNVGIGTTSPGEKLHVFTSSNTVGKFETSLTSDLAIELKNSQGSMFFGLGGGEEFAVGTTSDLNGTGNLFVIRQNGNVGIGAALPSTKLDVNGSASFNNAVVVDGLDTGNPIPPTNQTRISGYGMIGNRGSFYITNGSSNGTIYWGIGSNHNGATKMTLRNTGNLGIGTTAPNTKLEVGDCESSGNIADGNIAVKTKSNNTAIVIQEASGAEQWGLGVNVDGDLIFTDSGTERIRFDDGTGNVGIGTSSPSQVLHAKANDATLLLQDSTTSFSSQASGIILTCSDGSGNARTDVQYKLKVNSTNFEITYGSSNAQRFKIEQDGGLFVPSLLGSSDSNPLVRYNTTTGELYYNSSSIRYKEDVTDIESTIDKINKLRPVKFKVKESQQYTTGLIAEEVVEVIPELTFKNKVEGFDEPQIDGVSYGDLPTYLLKAIQEQQEMINELKTEIQTLKSQINS